MAEIAELSYLLTGKEKAVTLIDSVNNLRAALKSNGASMIVSVDANKEPIVDSADEDGLIGRHVVNVVRIDSGPPAKVFYQNQWGLHADRSKEETAVDAEKFLENMRSAGLKIYGQRLKQGLVLCPGDRMKAYRIVDGKFVEDKQETRAVRYDRRNLPN